MSRITEANVNDIGTFPSGTVATFRVPVGQREAFFELICDTESAMQFLESYAPVEHVE